MGFLQVATVVGHTSHYPDPIRFQPGDELELGKRDNEFPGWIWVRTPDGREGWAPEDFIERHSKARGVATANYTARELDTRVGELLLVHEELNDWLWVENQRGDRGWIPKRTAEETTDSRSG